MVAFALTSTLAALLTGSDDVLIRCPSAVVDPEALRASLSIEVPNANVLRATCEPTGRAGAAQIVFDLPDRSPLVVRLGDVVRSLRPRAAALALAAALASQPTAAPTALPTEDDEDASATSSSTPVAFAPASWSLDAAGQFVWLNDMYAGGELSRRIDLTGWRPASSPFGVSLVLAVSLLGTNAWQVETGTAATGAPWAFAIWARTGVEVDFAVSNALRVGPDLLLGGRGDLLRDGTIGYGLASAGVHLGWVFAPGVELVFALRTALRWNTTDLEPGVETTIGVRFPLGTFAEPSR